MQSYVIDFIAANRQFDWLEISLMYDTSDQYTMIYDSCNAELAAKKIGCLTVENNTNSRIFHCYSTANNLKVNLKSKHDMLYNPIAYQRELIFQIKNMDKIMKKG